MNRFQILIIADTESNKQSLGIALEIFKIGKFYRKNSLPIVG